MLPVMVTQTVAEREAKGVAEAAGAGVAVGAGDGLVPAGIAVEANNYDNGCYLHDSGLLWPAGTVEDDVAAAGGAAAEADR